VDLTLPCLLCVPFVTQIMEVLGGDRLWFDRFLAYHAAIVYYWVLVSVIEHTHTH